MNKKIYITLLLLVLSFSFVFINVKLIDAEEEEIYCTTSNFDSYSIAVEGDLLVMEVTDASGFPKENYLPVRYESQSYSTAIVCDWSLVNFSFISSIKNFTIDYEYWVVPGFDSGYYLYFDSFDIEYSYTYNNQFYAYNTYTMYLGEYGSPKPRWFNYDNEEIEFVRFFSGFDKYHIEEGWLPNEYLSYEEYSLNINYYTELVLYNNKPSVQINLEFWYPGIEEQFTYLYCYMPLDQLTLLTDSQMYPFVDEYFTTDIVSYSPIQTPMAYFTEKNKQYKNAYDNGFADGFADADSKLFLEDIDFTTWIVDAVGGFMSFEIIPGLSIISVLSFVISLGLLFLILRFFSGG